MSKDALACIACGARLGNVAAADNQPLDGLAFTTTGHYGTTFFDPMDGQQLEINVCDECLQKNTDKIGWRRAYREIECEGVQVGLEYLDRPMVPFTGQDDFEPPVSVGVEDLGKPLTRRVMWNAAACEDARRQAAINDSQSGYDADHGSEHGG
jgi:hypothetical protein